ncbi:MAG: DUF1232 domain-containing protein [Gammaproteobacteria bacterium]|jgi:uncharacterized membrane protein YkvA (DUF1232 family)|uniref:DUF1232 domain-containing protein n=1 Tax=unclassified Pseudacidovorax TaxID=2620592 RepID=UPI001B489EE3|nr:YkvA family protein [Pseudacidovorax sp.]MBP6894684.1 DUF1232 domain-containing protein [Pseudacidovorax sp.]
MWKLGRLWWAMRKELLLAWAVLRDGRSPWGAKLAVLAAAAYLISPLDLITDAVPLLGWLDDGIVVFLLLRLSQKLLPPGLSEALKARGATRRR